MLQEGIPSKILQRSSPISPVAIGGEEALRPGYIELHGDFEHVHLLVSDDGDRASIPRSIQLVAGRTGQDYNQRKGRKGAFWEDRYHATAVGTDRHLLQCIVYIDLNMVRAGVVVHPLEWIYIEENPMLIEKVFPGLHDRDPVLKARAVDVNEKTTREKPELLLDHKREIRRSKNEKL